MARIKLGDIFEIETPKGKAYLHYIFKTKSGIDLIRVLQGLYQELPENFGDLVRSKERYMIFFPLGAANYRKIVKRVGFYPADEFEKPQYMRTEHSMPGVTAWDIVDTDTWKRRVVKELTPEQIQLSDWAGWNDTLLIKRLIDDWKLEDWTDPS